jgi:hypothetical protein
MALTLWRFTASCSDLSHTRDSVRGQTSYSPPEVQQHNPVLAENPGIDSGRQILGAALKASGRYTSISRPILCFKKIRSDVRRII